MRREHVVCRLTIACPSRDRLAGAETRQRCDTDALALIPRGRQGFPPHANHPVLPVLDG